MLKGPYLFYRQTLFQFGPPEYQVYSLDYQYAVEELANQMDMIRKFFKIKEAKGWRKRWTEYVTQKYFPRRNRSPLVKDLIEQTTTTRNFLTMALLQTADVDEENPVLWRCMCKFWEKPVSRSWPPRKELPTTLTELVADCIEQVGRKKHGRKVFFSSLLSALKALPAAVAVFKRTVSGPNAGPTLFFGGVVLSGDDVTSLVKFFPYLLHLKGLKFPHCKIKTDGVTKIAEQLHFLQHLEKINMYKNDIGNEGVKKLAEKFHLLQKLKELSLQGNSISASGGTAIAENVAHLQALERLSLGENKVASSLPDLARSFAKMPRLRSVGLEYLGYEGEAEVAANAERVREAVDILCGSIRPYRQTTTLYNQTCGKSATDTTLVDGKWEAVKKVMKLSNYIVVIQSGNLDIRISLGLDV
ncbi:uncharacterized protein [Branchiostoma lanceolatum]|uniref:uncharacterized protein n=1 Tax=Branchiostoma lanceolatum TaxID=7740 RepID=UPI00345330DB